MVFGQIALATSDASHPGTGVMTIIRPETQQLSGPQVVIGCHYNVGKLHDRSGVSSGSFTNPQRCSSSQFAGNTTYDSF